MNADTPAHAYYRVDKPGVLPYYAAEPLARELYGRPDARGTLWGEAGFTYRDRTGRPGERVRVTVVPVPAERIPPDAYRALASGFDLAYSETEAG